MNKSILLVGEPMGLFIAGTTGPLESVDTFTLTTCGAELNVAIGLKRLGQPVSYMTKVGDDPFGRKIINRMKDTGIATDSVLYSETHPTGFMFKEKVTSGDPGIFYFRRGSAASTLSPEDVDALDFSRYRSIHMTGITPALTPSTRAATDRMIEKARAHGSPLSFDPHRRPQLWPDTRTMADYMNGVAAKADIFMPGIGEIEKILGETVPEKIADHYLKAGCGMLILKIGARGAYYATERESGYAEGFAVDHVVDTVGAGDGFAAGVLSGLSDGLSLADATRRGCAVGAIQVMSVGDNDGLPSMAELTAFMAGDPHWRKANED